MSGERNTDEINGLLRAWSAGDQSALDGLTTLRKALEVDTAKDASLVDIASILYTMHRESQMAEHALR